MFANVISEQMLQNKVSAAMTSWYRSVKASRPQASPLTSLSLPPWTVLDSPPGLYSGLKAWFTMLGHDFDHVDLDLPYDQIKDPTPPVELAFNFDFKGVSLVSPHYLSSKLSSNCFLGILELFSCRALWLFLSFLPFILCLSEVDAAGT
ncbi:hypothetical protein STEG23_014652, partial [Scotinomys teguina]